MLRVYVDFLVVKLLDYGATNPLKISVYFPFRIQLKAESKNSFNHQSVCWEYKKRQCIQREIFMISNSYVHPRFTLSFALKQDKIQISGTFFTEINTKPSALVSRIGLVYLKKGKYLTTATFSRILIENCILALRQPTGKMCKKEIIALYICSRQYFRTKSI